MISEESKKKLLCFAEWLETNVAAKNFDMASWTNHLESEVSMEDITPECGTTCCIAGWMAVADGHKLDGMVVNLSNGRQSLVDAWAGEKLGLTHDDYRLLFYPSNWPARPGRFLNRNFPNTPKGAADRIRYFVETGR